MRSVRRAGASFKRIYRWAQKEPALFDRPVRPKQRGNLNEPPIVFRTPKRRIGGIRPGVRVGSALQQQLDRSDVASHDCPKKRRHSEIVKFIWVSSASNDLSQGTIVGTQDCIREGSTLLSERILTFSLLTIEPHRWDYCTISRGNSVNA